MPEERAPDPTDADSDAATAEAEQPDGEQPGPGAVSRDEVTEEAPAAAPADPVAALQLERDELYGRVQRLSAEFDNYQKRIRREKTKWNQDVMRDLMTGLLPVLDNLEYAVAAFDKDVKDKDALQKGVVLVQDELLRLLGNHGVERMEVEDGDAFNSEQHQAVSMIPSPEVESEVIGGVARKGYTMGDFVLRPAQVLVKKPG
jgi:molecular chaperone GrpE